MAVLRLYLFSISAVFSLVSIVLAQDTVPHFEYTVTENATKGLYVGSVGTDARNRGYLDGSISVLTFQILAQGNPNADYFTIMEDTGELRTSKPILRDEICPNLDTCLLEFRIAVIEADIVLKITVDVFDTNNNEPKWTPSTIERSIPENTPVGSSISISTAKDPDSPKFSIKRYQMDDPVPQFQLKVRNISGTIDLYLVLNASVDREVTDSYTVKIRAFDGAAPPKSGLLTVNIKIQDNNDNRPTFEQEMYEVNIFEDAQIQSSVVQVSATDPDEGDNGEVIYAFAQRTTDLYGDVFKIDSKTGLITLKAELDYETETTYNLFVTAQERNPEFLPEEVRVVVNVADVNDHAPKITINALTTSGDVHVSESAAPGTLLAHITVEDPDTGYNGEFQCELTENPGNRFALDHVFDTFKLKTATRFDREAQDDYAVVLACTDQGSPTLTGTSTIRITVMDENDNYPAFSDSLFMTELDENNRVGQVLLRFRASDLDAGLNGQITYEIHNSAQNYVSYDPVSGNLTAKVSFDYEQFQSITFQITATDKGSPAKSSSATVLIKIRDLNDEAPEFLMPKYVFGVAEEQNIGEFVGQVSAIDRDNEPNNEFIYSLKPTVDASTTFVIEPLSGKILTQQKLDRELNDGYDMVVIATDKHNPSLSSTVSVSVYVVDVNDHAPQIDFPNADNNTVYISARPSDQKLPRILAHDNDVDQNAKLRYMLDVPDEHFIVDENTGQIYIQKDLNIDTNKKDTIKESFKLDIVVQDSGDNPLLARGTLVVIVNSTGFSSNSQSGNIISSSNLVIVIIVAIVSGVVTLCLVAAIVYLKRQDIGWRKKQASGSASKIVMATEGSDKQDAGDGNRKEVSFSNDVMEMETGGKQNSSYDGVNYKKNSSSSHDDQMYHQQQQATKPAQTKADKQWQVQHYLSHIPAGTLDQDSVSIHSNADSGMGSNEEHHQPSSPDKPRGAQGSKSAHPPIPPRAPIVRPGAPAPPRPSQPARSVTPSPYYGSGGNNFYPDVTKKPRRSNSLHGREDERDGRDNRGYSSNNHNVHRNNVAAHQNHNNPMLLQHQQRNNNRSFDNTFHNNNVQSTQHLRSVDNLHHSNHNAPTLHNVPPRGSSRSLRRENLDPNYRQNDLGRPSTSSPRLKLDGGVTIRQASIV